MNRYLLYSSKSYKTGKKLGQYLDIECGKIDDMRDVRYDYLIRWGASDGVHYIPEIKTINKKSAILENTNKMNSLRVIEEGGLNVPKYTEDYNELDYPFLSRRINHTQGRDINLILQKRDLRINGEGDYYLEYIPKKKEYRVHIIGDEIVKINEKKYRNDDDENEYIPECWNYETGFIFGVPHNIPPEIYSCISAVKSLGLDFGAVDVIFDEEDNMYVLEVNTSPSLSENNLEIYGDKLADMINLEEYPAMDNVIFDEEVE